jgi:hypothetical protein
VTGTHLTQILSTLLKKFGTGKPTPSSNLKGIFLLDDDRIILKLISQN